MKISTLLASLLVAGFAGTIAPRVAHADVKLAYVDLQRALEETDDGKKAKAKLKSDFDKKQKELDEKQDDLKKMKEDLDKKSSLMKPDALAAQQQQFQQRFVQLQETYARLQRDLAAKEQEATHGIFTKLSMAVVAQIADRRASVAGARAQRVGGVGAAVAGHHQRGHSHVQRRRRRQDQVMSEPGGGVKVEAPLDVAAIERLLPHRYPFLLIDRVIELSDDHVVALKNVTINEPFFPGHFPGHPVMPGVLIVESMAQAGGVMALRYLGAEAAGKVIYFMGLDKVKFRKPVTPGDQLRLEVKPLRRGASIWKMEGRALVDGAVVAEAEFLATINPR